MPDFAEPVEGPDGVPGPRRRSRLPELRRATRSHQARRAASGGQQAAELVIRKTLIGRIVARWRIARDLAGSGVKGERIDDQLLRLSFIDYEERSEFEGNAWDPFCAITISPPLPISVIGNWSSTCWILSLPSFLCTLVYSLQFQDGRIAQLDWSISLLELKRAKRNVYDGKTGKEFCGTIPDFEGSGDQNFAEWISLTILSIHSFYIKRRCPRCWKRCYVR